MFIIQAAWLRFAKMITYIKLNNWFNMFNLLIHQMFNVSAGQCLKQRCIRDRHRNPHFDASSKSSSELSLYSKYDKCLFSNATILSPLTNYFKVMNVQPNNYEVQTKCLLVRCSRMQNENQTRSLSVCFCDGVHIAIVQWNQCRTVEASTNMDYVIHCMDF